MKKVSVIILNWNGAGLLRRYLPEVIAHTSADTADVIVADNGSTDDSLSLLGEEFPSVRVWPLGGNYGYAGGYNRALAMAETPYCVLLNSDAAPAEGWLGPLLAYAEKHPETAALQPKLLSDRDRKMFEYAGAAGGYLDCLGYPYCRGRIFDVVEQDCGQYDMIAPVMWATGACLWIRTEAFRQAGGLDERFFAHMEEIDLCWRLRRLGYTLACVPQSVVYHLGGASLAMGHPKKTYLNFRNSLLMLWKNLPDTRREGFIFRRKCLDALAACNFLLHGEWRHVKAIFLAHRDAGRMIRDGYGRDAGTGADIMHDAFGNAGTCFKEERISILKAFYLQGRKRYACLFA